MEGRRQEVHNSVRVLTDIVRHLNAGLNSVARKIESGLERIQKYDFWRWTVMLGEKFSVGNFISILRNFIVHSHNLAQYCMTMECQTNL